MPHPVHVGLQSAQIALQNQLCGHGIDFFLMLFPSLSALAEYAMGVHRGAALIPEDYFKPGGLPPKNIPGGTPRLNKSVASNRVPVDKPQKGSIRPSPFKNSVECPYAFRCKVDWYPVRSNRNPSKKREVA